jgi:hypothetical protein
MAGVNGSLESVTIQACQIHRCDPWCDILANIKKP